MKPFSLLTLVVLLASFNTVVYAQSTTTPTDQKAAQKSPAQAKTKQATAKQATSQAPDEAAPKLGPDGNPNAGFVKAHEKFVEIAEQGTAQLIFLGDSITAGWGKQDIWDQAFGKYQPANFGIGGDRTQHVLWRITNGELEVIQPKAIVLMIGTNNAGTDTAEGIASGITKIVETIRTKQPQAKILLLAVFPRGQSAESDPRREKLALVNRMIAEMDDGRQIHYLDIGEKFLQPDGSISKDIMPDYLHLSEAGYQIWADAIGPKLEEMMK